MKPFKYSILFCLFQSLLLLSCNRHGIYSVGASRASQSTAGKVLLANEKHHCGPVKKLVISGGGFKVESEGNILEVISQVAQARLALQNLPSPFPSIEGDIDYEYYDYGQSQDYPFGPDKQISHRVDKEPKHNLAISTDLCIVGASGKKYFLYPPGKRNRRCPSDDAAYYVSQGSVCYATDKKMGTDNVQDCVALIMQDKNSGKTALAHLSTASLVPNDNDVDKILAYMPKGPKDVIVVGGQHKSGEANLETILKSLSQYSDTIDIIQAYCGNSGSLIFGYENTSFYHINTNFGNVIVDTKGLKITADFAAGKLPLAKCEIEFRHYDLDKMRNE